MVQVAVMIDRSPSSPFRDRTYSDAETVNKERTESRMSVENASEEDDSRLRGSPNGDAKAPSVEMSTPPRLINSGSPKPDGFSSTNVCHDDQPPRRRAVLDLSMHSAFSRKGCLEREIERSTAAAFSRSQVPPYSPMSSSGSTSSSNGSPSNTPEASKPDEVSIHDIAREVTDRRSRASSFSTNTSSTHSPASAASGNSSSPEFDLPRNFYGYYVYQLELASRYSSNLRNTPVGLGNSSPDNRGHCQPLVGKVKPTMKNDPKDDEVVSYGSLLEQALRNGLKRSPTELPVGNPEKKAKTATSPPPSVNQQVPTQRNLAASQISVEDVAKTSLRELLHGKQIQESKSAQGSRSSSPAGNLKALLESQTRQDQLKNQPFRQDLMALNFTNGFPKQMPHHQIAGKPSNAPHIYPHVLNRASSPSVVQRNGGLDHIASQQSFLPQHLSGGYKHKKLLEWTAADVRDWVSTLNYCSEFSDIFLQQSVDGVALTLLNESHLMKNFGMKLGPAIKIRCAVWEILGLCQAQSVQHQMQLTVPQFMPQKPIPVGHCIPQHQFGSKS